MKKSLLIFVLSIVGLSSSFSQVTVSGSSCTVSGPPDRAIDGTYISFGVVNGKNAYLNFTSGGIISYISPTGPWAIQISNVSHYTNTNDLGVNPPATGWVIAPGGGCTGASTPTLSGDISLPVELTSFQATAESQQVALTWQTASEEINKGFDIERSANGETWETIGFVAGAGTTLETQDYTFTDEAPLSGKNYYRLKQLDFDGVFDYSEIVSVEMDIEQPDLRVFPNPVGEVLNVQGITAGQVTIYNTLGQPMRNLAITSDNMQIAMQDFPKGHYMVEIIPTNGERMVKRIVKQ